jgi:hypothetical protein
MCKKEATMAYHPVPAYTINKLTHALGVIAGMKDATSFEAAKSNAILAKMIAREIARRYGGGDTRDQDRGAARGPGHLSAFDFRLLQQNLPKPDVVISRQRLHSA